MIESRSAERPDPEPLFLEIADYVLSSGIESKEAYDTARLCLMDSVGCMMLALTFPACTKLLGPVVPGAEMKQGGVRVPGTKHERVTSSRRCKAGRKRTDGGACETT